MAEQKAVKKVEILHGIIACGRFQPLNWVTKDSLMWLHHAKKKNGRAELAIKQMYSGPCIMEKKQLLVGVWHN